MSVHTPRLIRISLITIEAPFGSGAWDGLRLKWFR
jgi:hypothetical protein